MTHTHHTGGAMIHKCALAVIEKRGQGVVGPSLNPVDPEEESFLHRHVEKLRAAVHTNHARGRFRSGSFLEVDIQNLLVATDADFLASRTGMPRLSRPLWSAPATPRHA
jgi:hypothetical protein